MKSNLSIDFPTLITTVYVLVDDWYRKTYKQIWTKVGVRPKFSESEMITLALMMDYLPFPIVRRQPPDEGETQFLAFMRGNYLEWFPNLPAQSQFNRRLRRLDGKLEQMRRTWVVELGATSEKNFLIDTKPLPVLGLKRDKKQSDFAGNAAPGWCAARQMRYFGYKLVMLATWTGIPIAYDLVPANTDERVAVVGVLEMVNGSNIYGDKGFLDSTWQQQLQQRTGNCLWTIKRVNQHQQHSPSLNRWISRIRQRIEGVFHEIQNTGRKERALVE